MRLGIDIGGSYIKAAALGEDGTLLSGVMERSLNIASAVPRLAAYVNEACGMGAESICVTGVGSALIPGELLGLPVLKIPEFQAIAVGGLYNTGISEAVVISIGTGSALVHAAKGSSRHLGGSGVGGGTIEGLARSLFGTDSFHEIDELSDRGDTRNVDLLIRDVATAEIPGLPGDATGANLAKLEEGSDSSDAAAGILNLVFQTVGTLGVLACRELGINDVIVTGSVAEFRRAPELLAGLTGLYGTRFTIPVNPAYRTAVGAALIPWPLGDAPFWEHWEDI